MLNLDDLLDAVSDEEFDEIPVHIEEFVTSEDYLNQPPLSKYQYTLIKMSTQIYKKETLYKIYGEEVGHKRWQETKREVIMMLGKGNQASWQRVWSPEYGYVLPEQIDDAWIAETHRGNHAAVPFYNEGPDDIYRITTRRGYTVDVGINHKLPAWKKTKHGKSHSIRKNSLDLPVKALIPGDFLHVKAGWQEPIPEIQYNCTEDDALLIGYMIGDNAFVRSDGSNPELTNATPEVQKDFIRIIESKGGIYKEYNSGYGCWEKLNQEFLKFGLGHEYNVEKPWNYDWMKMSDRNLAALIRGVWATDGWLFLKNNSPVFGLELTSESIIKGLHIALLRLGIYSSVRLHRKSTDKHKATWRLYVTGCDQALMFLNVIGFPLGKEKRCAEIYDKLSKIKTKITNPHADSIEKIELIGRDEKTFGTMVEVDSTYVAGGIVNCNSGKDHCSTLACAYVVYLLLCLKDPQKYYNKPPGDAIDIINIALNADQASRVFFKGLVEKIRRSPWFQGKYQAKANGEPAQNNEIHFDKSINIYSGHSEREAFEGYNVIFAILDEIAGFAVDNTSGNKQAQTADDTYAMYSASVLSRFPDFGKLLLLSFPRFKGDFITRRYDQVIADKEVVIRSESIKIDPDGPDMPSNYYEFEWEEDRIINYREPGVYALKRPSWEVNPTRKVSDYLPSFIRNITDALGRFACMPPEAVDAFFKDKEKLKFAFCGINGVEEDGSFRESFVPDPDKKYYVHVDLARKHDHCAVALAHVEKWVTKTYGQITTEPAPQVVVDAVRWWTPTTDKNVDFTEVRDYIVSLKKRGFDIKLVTFDRWNCLPGDSLVTTEKGPVSIQDINAGDKVLTRFGFSEISSKIDSGIQDIYRVTTKLGYEFNATENHKVLTKDGWKRVKDLADDVLILNQGLFEGQDIIDENQAYVFGALIADGWINDKKDNVISIVSADKDFIDCFDEKIKEGWGFFNKTVKSSKKKEKEHHKEIYDYKYNDKAMISKMRSLGLSRSTSYTKRVPYSVMNGSNKVKAAFIAGYFDGNGGIQSYGKDVIRFRASMDTRSELLAKDLNWLFLSMGLEPTRLRQKRKGINHRFTFEGRKAERFFDVIKPVIKRKFGITNPEIKDIKERWNFINGQAELPVVKIEKIGQQQTYDISVPENQEFICDGFVTHNSDDMINYLNSIGIKAAILSVAKRHYDDMSMVVADERLLGPAIDLLINELSELQITKADKVDHPRKGSKDLSDAVCGAIYNSISHTIREYTDVIEAETYSQIVKREKQEKVNNIISPPKRIPPDIAEYLSNITIV